MSATDPALQQQLSQGIGDATLPRFAFELHYGLSCESVRSVLLEILEDISSRKNIHNWDEKLHTSAFAALVKVGRRWLIGTPYGTDKLLPNSVVEEILTVGRAIRRPPAAPEAGDVDGLLFFSKAESSRISRFQDSNVPSRAKEEIAVGEVEPSSLKFAQGRIIYIKDQIPHIERAALLILYTFCIRLQYEDRAYICNFIERHLSPRCALKVPYHWQDTSPPELDSSRQKCYKRVTISCHIVYLTLNSGDGAEKKDGLFDRNPVFSLHHRGDTKNPSNVYLFKATSSVLLTLAIPEESESREEEVNLLRTPEALWTVLVVNCSSEFVSDHGPQQYLTPIAQYIRGIASSLSTQRINTQSIYDIIREGLKISDEGSIFDDEHFTKSTSYHWAVKTCDELDESIGSTLRFIRRLLNTQVDKLSREAHIYERHGVDYWAQKLREEVFALEDLQAQIMSMSAQVKESRNALHGVTAVLEARIALQQGDRMKILAYLATVYIPLTAASGVYSISVLPSSASFPSFFVVFAILFLFTILLGINLRKILSGVPRLLRPSNLRLGPLIQLYTWTKNYMLRYLHLLNPYRDLKANLDWHSDSSTSIVYKIVWALTYGLAICLLRGLVLPEIFMPVDQYTLFLYRNNRFVTIKYHWIWVIKDIVRGILIPAWIALATAIVCYFVALDVIWELSYLVLIGTGLAIGRGFKQR